MEHQPSSSKHFYQSTYVWRETEQDGLLPVCNYVEEASLGDSKKKSKRKEQQRQQEEGEVTLFSDGKESSGVEPGSYVFVKSRGAYGQLVSKRGESSWATKFELEGDETEIAVSDMQTKVEISIRIAFGEDNTYSLNLFVSPNLTMRELAEEISDYVGKQKYNMSFFYKGKKLKVGQKLGEVGVGTEIGQN